MCKQVIVIAPHPDDETLGCGGTLLRHKAEGDQIHWLIVSGMKKEDGFSREQFERRNKEIKQVAESYGFSSVNNLELPATRLDSLPIGVIIEQISALFKQINPEVIYVPFRGDVHTDHRIVFDAAVACTKWFRFSSVKRILAYETLSETDFGMNSGSFVFQPNTFINISSFLEKKLEIMKIYASEVGQFPFPRSTETIRSLSALRGAAVGCKAAEAFMLLKEIV